MPLAEFLDNIVMKEYKKPRKSMRGFVYLYGKICDIHERFTAFRLFSSNRFGCILPSGSIQAPILSKLS